MRRQIKAVSPGVGLKGRRLRDAFGGERHHGWRSGRRHCGIILALFAVEGLERDASCFYAASSLKAARRRTRLFQQGGPWAGSGSGALVGSPSEEVARDALGISDHGEPTHATFVPPSWLLRATWTEPSPVNVPLARSLGTLQHVEPEGPAQQLGPRTVCATTSGLVLRVGSRQ